MQAPDEKRLFTEIQALPALASIASDYHGLGAEARGDVYLVGGTVRDLILGRPFVDVDVAVDGDAFALAASLGALQRSETRFGTFSVTRDGHRYDLVRTRGERYPRPGALPEVEPARIETDLIRRDFTVNALALGLSGSHAGQLLAAPGALDDLGARRLAVLHDRSFLDDPTRLLRLARYAARLGFEPAPHTLELAHEAIANHALDTISGTRIGNELRLLATEPDPVAAFEAVQDLGLPWTIDAEATRRALEVLPADGRAELLVLGAVFGGWRDKPLGPQLDHLGFTASDRNAIAEAATRAPELARRLASTNSRAEIARTVGTAGIETVALAFSQGAPSQSLTWLQELRHLRLQITGDDLIQHGVEEGPAIGRGLAGARSALMEGEAVDRESQLRVALRAAE